MDQIEYATCLIEMDALFDTRLAVLYQLNPEVAEQALQTDYKERLQDEFKGLVPGQFQEAYSKRSKAVLEHALVTSFTRFVQEFVLQIVNQLSTTPFHHRPKLIINSYPYHLSDEEAAEIINAVVSITREDADVEMVHLSYEEITPNYVKAELAVMVLYDYPRWLEIHSENGLLKKTSCPEVCLIGPAIFFKEPNKIILRKCASVRMTPFQAMEKIAEPLIGLQLYPIEHFSIALKPAA